MKKLGRQKIIAILTLTTLLTFLSAPVTRAQEVKLLPNAAETDYEIQAIPPQARNYEIKTAQGPFDDPIVRWLIENTLGKLVNEALGQVGENMMKWTGDVIHFGIINVYTLFAGQEGLKSSGYCTPTENNCRDGYEPLLSGDGSACRCVRSLATGPRNPADYGVLGVLGAMTTGVLQQGPPDMHTAQFFQKELAENILARPAYAQTGVAFFDPIITIAALMRNLAYVFMAAILVLMGLMIMLRYKVDPRTTMTVTAALPRVAMSIILIAFSYPLAGIIVDLGRLIKRMIDVTFGPLMPLSPIEPFNLIVDLFGNFWAVSIINPFTWGGFGNISLGGPGVFAFFISVGLMTVAVVITFMLFFTLVFRFAALFAQVIFAPLAFAWGTLPGQEETITKWFKSFAVNVLTFPVIYFLVNLANYIANISLTQPLPLPADLGWGTVAAFWPTNVGGLVAFGLLVAATKVPAMLEEALEVSAPAAVTRAGVEPGKILTRVPVVGGLFK